MCYAVDESNVAELDGMDFVLLVGADPRPWGRATGAAARVRQSARTGTTAGLVGRVRIRRHAIVSSELPQLEQKLGVFFATVIVRTVTGSASRVRHLVLGLLSIPRCHR